MADRAALSSILRKIDESFVLQQPCMQACMLVWKLVEQALSVPVSAIVPVEPIAPIGPITPHASGPTGSEHFDQRKIESMARVLAFIKAGRTLPAGHVEVIVPIEPVTNPLDAVRARWRMLEPWHDDRSPTRVNVPLERQILLELQDFITQAVAVNADCYWMRSRIRNIIRERMCDGTKVGLNICLKNAHDCGAIDTAVTAGHVDACKCTNGKIFFRDVNFAENRAMHGNAAGSVPTSGEICSVQVKFGACHDALCKYNHVREQYFHYQHI
jgi:hypothetical protein